MIFEDVKAIYASPYKRHQRDKSNTYYFFLSLNPHGYPPPEKVKGYFVLVPIKTWRCLVLSLPDGNAGTQLHSSANPRATAVSGIIMEVYESPTLCADDVPKYCARHLASKTSLRSGTEVPAFNAWRPSLRRHTSDPPTRKNLRFPSLTTYN